MAMFDNIVDEDRLASMSEAELNAVADILKDYNKAHIYTVTDGEVRVNIYRDRGGFLLCDNLPQGHNGVAYWDYYSDLVEFASEYNPDLDVQVAWVEDLDGNQMFDEDE